MVSPKEESKRTIRSWFFVLPLLGLGGCLVSLGTCGFFVYRAATESDRNLSAAREMVLGAADAAKLRDYPKALGIYHQALELSSGMHEDLIRDAYYWETIAEGRDDAAMAGLAKLVVGSMSPDVLAEVAESKSLPSIYSHLRPETRASMLLHLYPLATARLQEIEASKAKAAESRRKRIKSALSETLQPEALVRAKNWRLADESLKKIEAETTALSRDGQDDVSALAKKVSSLRGKIAKGIERERQVYEADVARRGKLPEHSPWDGSIREVDRYLKSALKDPDSYEHERCGDIYGEGDFWTVECQYRARNSFGGFVRERKKFFIRFEKVARVK